MKLYALFIGIPLALLIQHLYEVTNENFKNKTHILSITTITSILFLSFMSLKNQWLDFNICVELIMVSIGGSIISFIIHKSKKKLELDNLQFHEKIICYVEMLFGVICCTFPWTCFFERLSYGVCSSEEILLSRLLYVACGCSYLFYNRLIICMIYKSTK